MSNLADDGPLFKPRQQPGRSERPQNSSGAIADIEKNARETLRVQISEYRGHPLADLRVWVPKRGSGDLVPTAKGVSFNVALLPDIISALTEAEREARDAGLMPDG